MNKGVEQPPARKANDLGSNPGGGSIVMSRRFVVGEALLTVRVKPISHYVFTGKLSSSHWSTVSYIIIIWRTPAGMKTEVIRNGKSIIFKPTKVQELDPVFWKEKGEIEL